MHMVFTATPAAHISTHRAVVGGELDGIVTKAKHDDVVVGSGSVLACTVSRNRIANKIVGAERLQV